MLTLLAQVAPKTSMLAAALKFVGARALICLGGGLLLVVIVVVLVVAVVGSRKRQE